MSFRDMRSKCFPGGGNGRAKALRSELVSGLRSSEEASVAGAD